jgi:alkylated DNA nucleotide flippase Atl1
MADGRTEESMKKRKSWREKLDDAKDLPKVVAIPPGMQSQWGTGTMVIPAPVEVDQIMRRVPKGKLITINGIREILARKHGATLGCPITAGIFARIAAGAAEEDEAEGKKRVTPYWRTLKSGGELNSKYPGGNEGQRAKLEAEGHTVVCKGKRCFVREYERSKVRL